jgi:adenylosuccinate synthase
MIKVVIGLGFGDEGKGITTDYLCSKSKTPLVVRYSGGSQAGHTVDYNGIKHVFSSFGSGTLRGVPTYWSQNCALDPIGMLNELDILKSKGIKPKLYIDPESPIITPYDRVNNQFSNSVLHGTCGIGFGDTIEREENFRKLHFKDLFNNTILKIKFQLIREYYINKFKNYNHNYKDTEIYEIETETNKRMESFFNSVQEIKEIDNIEMNRTIYTEYLLNESETEITDLIFEGSQGLLLDENFGFFPNVTRSSVGSRNIPNIDEIYYVTRAYQTRHGNGPMTNEDLEFNIIENIDETNVHNKWQGNFRRTILDLDLLKYAISCDMNTNQNPKRKKLVITCLDQVEGNWKFTNEETLHTFDNENDFVNSIRKILGIEEIIRFRSPKTPS